MDAVRRYICIREQIYKKLINKHINENIDFAQLLYLVSEKVYGKGNSEGNLEDLLPVLKCLSEVVEGELERKCIELYNFMIFQYKLDAEYIGYYDLANFKIF